MLVCAAERAVALRTPFNRFVSINWAKVGIDDGHAAAATGRFIKLVSDWLRKRAHRLAWMWIRENDVDGHRKGTHVHILLHLPKGVGIRGRTQQWVKLAARRPYRKRAIRSGQIRGAPTLEQVASPTYLINLAGLMAYVLKGVAADTAARLRLEEFGRGGRIIGKRCAVSSRFTIRPTTSTDTLGLMNWLDPH